MFRGKIRFQSFIFFGVFSIVISSPAFAAGGKRDPVGTPTPSPTPVNPDHSKEVPVSVGMFFMPQGDDIFWRCLKGENCGFQEWRKYSSQFPKQTPLTEKYPSLGFYDNTEASYWEKTIPLMKSNGIDYIVFDWFYDQKVRPWIKGSPKKIENGAVIEEGDWQNLADEIPGYPRGEYVDASNANGAWSIPQFVKNNGALGHVGAMYAYMNYNQKLPRDQQVKFSILWCDDDVRNFIDYIKEVDGGLDQTPNKEMYLKVIDKMYARWINYFKRDDFYKPNNTPVVYILGSSGWFAKAARYGFTLKELMDRARSKAKEAGFNGVQFIDALSSTMNSNMSHYAINLNPDQFTDPKKYEGNEHDSKHLLMQDYFPLMVNQGFDGISSYYHHAYETIETRGYPHAQTENFDEHRDVYKGHWKRWTEEGVKLNPNFKHHIPVAVGWDRRGAGGSWEDRGTGFPNVPWHDQVQSNPEQFKLHLIEARDFIANHKQQTDSTVVVCCWNEYLEGNVVEPTAKYGEGYLKAIKEVFGLKATNSDDLSVTGGPTQPEGSGLLITIKIAVETVIRTIGEAIESGVNYASHFFDSNENKIDSKAIVAHIDLKKESENVANIASTNDLEALAAKDYPPSKATLDQKLACETQFYQTYNELKNAQKSNDCELLKRSPSSELQKCKEVMVYELSPKAKQQILGDSFLQASVQSQMHEVLTKVQNKSSELINSKCPTRLPAAKPKEEQEAVIEVGSPDVNNASKKREAESAN